MFDFRIKHMNETEARNGMMLNIAIGPNLSSHTSL